jgi:tetratricopeptide (TPR) repeat protein
MSLFVDFMVGGRSVLARICLLSVAAILAAAIQPGLARAEGPSVKAKPAVAMPLYQGLGAVHHPVTTTSPLAQQYFDQGLALTYGFNHDEARRSFEQAARIDPAMAMAYWGIALVLGPNYNLPGDKERGKKAHDAIGRAHALEANVTPKERDLIQALVHRYGADGKETPERDKAYADAMRTVAHRYPDDPDVQTLFAESLMDLHPWQLWTIDGEPGVDTVEIVDTLEGVLKKHPDHIGANHYYIHAVEASRDPSRAGASADRLGALAPGAGHLVHMPAHIYIRTGRFHDSAQTNEKAIKADEAFFAQSQEQGVYPFMYYPHNIHFLCYSQMMEGRGRDALKTARMLESRVPLQAVREMPMLEFLVPVPYMVEARFAQWDLILKEPAPPKDLPYTSAIWHYARGLAFAAKEKLADAARERKELDAIVAAMAPDRPLGSSNSAKKVSELAALILQAEIASAKGDHGAAVAKLTDGVRMQDALIYDEPPIWYFPVRESLGAELLAMGQATKAEKVYREDLKINPGNPHSLYGLARCLRAQGKTEEAAEVQNRFKQAWRYADAGQPQSAGAKED